MNAPDPLPPAAEGAAPPGHRLGHFELRGVVAQGDDDVVYRAWDLELGIAVAIKEYFPRRLVRRNTGLGVEPLDVGAGVAFEGGREAFVDEARLLARCDHASLLRVRHLLRAHGTACRVMPWYGGWPLADLRREMDRPPDEMALRRLLLDVLGALESWHRVAGAHGGVNPSRILLLDDDRALLLGPRMAARNAVGANGGSQADAIASGFLAPEARMPSGASPAVPSSDFFALAQVVRFCITGMLPTPDAAEPEPLAETVGRLYFDLPGVRYGEDLLRTLDAAASPTIAKRPRTVSEFRDWLDHGPPRAEAAGAPPALADAAASTASEPAAASAEVARLPDVAAAHDVPAPTGSRDTAARMQDRAADDATVDLIRRVIEAIPDRDAPPPRAEPRLAVPPAEPVLRADLRAEPSPEWPRRRSGARWGWLVGALLLAGIGYGASVAGWLTDWHGVDLRSLVRLPPSIVATRSTPADEAEAPVVPASAARSAPATAELRPPVAADTPLATIELSASAPTPTPTPTPTADASAADAPAAAAQRVDAPAMPPPRATDAVVPAPSSPRAGPDSPRQACGERTQFALYRCMQAQCASPALARHPQCLQLKATDRVD